MTVPKLASLAQNLVIPPNSTISSGFSTAPTYNRPSGKIGVQIKATFPSAPAQISVTLGLGLEMAGPFEPLAPITVPPPASGLTATKIVSVDASHANYITVLQATNSSVTENATITISATL